MKQIVIVSLGVFLCFLLICNARASVLPDDTDDSLDGYVADDKLRNAIMAVLAGEADKRGFRCRPGYTYQSVLRDCVPSLGMINEFRALPAPERYFLKRALRGRGGRRQG